MKNIIRLNCIFVLSLFGMSGIFSQSLLVENFDYPSGDSLRAHSWILNSATSGPVMSVFTSGLTYTGYPGSGIGNSVTLIGNGNTTTSLNGQDLYRAFTAEQSSGSVYVSFMLNVTSQPSAQDYFFHMSPAAPSGKYQGRLFIKKGVGTGFQLGISKLGTFIQWIATEYNLNTTYVILLKYVIVNDVLGTDDYCQLFVDPSLTGSDPSTPGAQSVDTTADAKIGSVMLRQGGVTYNYIQIDGIRASTSWSDLALPVELTSFTGKLNGNSIELFWSTATEVNNYGFEVERNTGGGWQTVGFVDGNGTTNSPKSYSFVDAPVYGTVSYRLKQIDRDGKFEYSAAIDVSAGAAQSEFRLHGNYPNPFNPSTVIRFSVAADAQTAVKIFNVLGQEVAVLFNGMAEAGKVHEVAFDASSFSSGLYFSRLESNGRSVIGKMMLMK